MGRLIFIRPQYHLPELPQLNGSADAEFNRARRGRRRLTQNEKDDKTLCRGHYVELTRISGSKAEIGHKVIYCVATLK